LEETLFFHDVLVAPGKGAEIGQRVLGDGGLKSFPGLGEFPVPHEGDADLKIRRLGIVFVQGLGLIEGGDRLGKFSLAGQDHSFQKGDLRRVDIVLFRHGDPVFRLLDSLHLDERVDEFHHRFLDRGLQRGGVRELRDCLLRFVGLLVAEPQEKCGGGRGGVTAANLGEDLHGLLVVLVLVLAHAFFDHGLHFIRFRRHPPGLFGIEYDDHAHQEKEEHKENIHKFDFFPHICTTLLSSEMIGAYIYR